MNQNGNLTDLAGRLREKTQVEQQKTEQLIQDTLKNVSENLQKRLAEERSTINHAISKNTSSMIRRMNFESQILNWSFVKAWIRTALIGIALSIGLCVGLWFTVDWLAETVSSNIRQLHNLEEMIREQQKTLNILHKETFGVTLYKQHGKKYIFIPKGATTTKMINRDGIEFHRLEY